MSNCSRMESDAAFVDCLSSLTVDRWTPVDATRLLTIAVKATHVQATRPEAFKPEPRECPACWGNGYTYARHHDDKIPCGICAQTGKVVPYAGVSPLRLPSEE